MPIALLWETLRTDNISWDCVFTQFQRHEANVQDNWQLAVLHQSEGREFNSIPAGSTIIYRFRFFCWFICASLCQSIKIKPTNNIRSAKQSITKRCAYFRDILYACLFCYLFIIVPGVITCLVISFEVAHYVAWSGSYWMNMYCPTLACEFQGLEYFIQSSSESLNSWSHQLS